MMSSVTALGLGVQMVCVARLVSLAEFLVRWRQFRPGGLLDFTVSQPVRKTRGAVIQTIGAVADEVNLRYFPAVLAMEGVSSVLLVARPTIAPVILIAIVTQLLIMKRIEIAIDGSDQMILVVLVAAGAGFILPEGRASAAACFFLAANLCLSYFSSGAYKAAGVQWVRGEALARVLSTETFGSPRLAWYLRKSGSLSLVSCWAVILWECSFPAALVAPPWVLLSLLGFGAIFHILCGLTMGLTNFPLAFGASYPALVYVNACITHLHGLESVWLVIVCLSAAAAFGLARYARRRDCGS